MRTAYFAVVEHIDEKQVLFVEVFEALKPVQTPAVLPQGAGRFGRELLELSGTGVLRELQVDHDVRLAAAFPPRPRFQNPSDQLEVVPFAEKKLELHMRTLYLSGSSGFCTMVCLGFGSLSGFGGASLVGCGGNRWPSNISGCFFARTGPCAGSRDLATSPVEGLIIR